MFSHCLSFLGKEKKRRCFSECALAGRESLLPYRADDELSRTWWPVSGDLRLSPETKVRKFIKSEMSFPLFMFTDLLQIGPGETLSFATCAAGIFLFGGSLYKMVA